MGRKDERSEPPVTLKRPTGNLVKSLVEKFEKKCDSPSSKSQEQERPSIVEPILEKPTSNSDETYDFSLMQNMKFFRDASVDKDLASVSDSPSVEFRNSCDFDTAREKENIDPTFDNANSEFQTSFDFPDPFSDPFDPFESSEDTNDCSSPSEIVREPILSSAISKMQTKFRQKVSDFASPHSGQRPRVGAMNLDVPFKSPGAGERQRISTLSDVPLSSVPAKSPGTGRRPRISMIPDLPLTSVTVKSPGVGLRPRLSIAAKELDGNNSSNKDWSPDICLSPTSDPKTLDTFSSPVPERKPRISMASTAKSPKTPGRRRISLAPVTPTNELSNRVKVLISPDDMKRIRLSLSAGDKLTLDSTNCLQTTRSGGASGNPTRIAVRSKVTNGEKKMICKESLQALFSQHAQLSASAHETRSMSTTRHGQRRTSLTMTPNTGQKTKVRITPADIVSLKDDFPKSDAFQKQRRRHSFSASSRGLFVDDASEHGFDVITDRAGQSIAPAPDEAKSRRKKKKKSARRDLV